MDVSAGVPRYNKYEIPKGDTRQKCRGLKEITKDPAPQFVNPLIHFKSIKSGDRVYKGDFFGES